MVQWSQEGMVPMYSLQRSLDEQPARPDAPAEDLRRAAGAAPASAPDVPAAHAAFAFVTRWLDTARGGATVKYVTVYELVPCNEE